MGRRTIIVIVSFVLSAAGALACDCAEVTVLWVEPEQRKYYVALDETTELTVRAKVYDLVEEIAKEQPEWAGQVRIGFLLAGAASEPHEPAATEYFADFDQASSRLTFAPASAAPRSVELFVYSGP